MLAEHVVALRVSRPAGIIIGILAIVVLDALVWGVLTTQTLSTTQGQLAGTTQRLAGTTQELAGSAQQLSDAARDLAASRAEIAQLTSDKAQLVSSIAQLTSANTGLMTSVADLTGEVAKQTQCVAALRADVVALQSITALARTNLGRVGKGSAWAKAYDKVARAFAMAAREGRAARRSSHRPWIDRGMAGIRTMRAQMRIVEGVTTSLDAARAAATAAVNLSAMTCGS
jgi:hypothetical protein